MRYTKILNRLTVLAALVFLTLALTAPGLTQTGGSYDLTWSTMDGGGSMFSTAGSYSLGGTIGQADAGVVLSAGSYTLVGGFWHVAETAAAHCIYLPLVLRN